MRRQRQRLAHQSRFWYCQCWYAVYCLNGCNSSFEESKARDQVTLPLVQVELLLTGSYCARVKLEAQGGRGLNLSGVVALEST